MFINAIGGHAQGYHIIYKRSDGAICATDTYTAAVLDDLKDELTAAGYTVLGKITDEKYREMIDRR